MNTAWKNMKSLGLILTLLFVISACGDRNMVDRSKPEEVVEAIFKAANTLNFEVLSGLCAPDCDDDCRLICELKPELQIRFIEHFSKGRLNGKAVIEGDKAKVPFLYGPDGKKEETMNLVRIDGKWYIQSF